MLALQLQCSQVSSAVGRKNVASMSNPNFKLAFAQYPGAMEPGKCLAKTVIKIIDLQHEKDTKWKESTFWKQCEAEGIQISFLSNPCVLTTVPNAKNGQFSECEVRHAFTGSFWPSIQREKVAGSICISHARALAEGLAQHPDLQLIIVLEGDVVLIPNTMKLMAAFIANWYGNEDIANAKYAALTYSDWHPKHAAMVVAHPQIINSTRVDPYFHLQQLPRTGGSFNFVGQGGRALAYSPDFAQEIASKQFTTWFDMHVLRKISELARAAEQAKRSTYAMALVAHPAMFRHDPDLEQRFRGSARLDGLQVNPAEGTSYFICLNVSKGWGVSNRLQTIVLWLAFCSWHRMGLYILWESNAACKCTLHDIVTINTEEPPLHTVPFVKVYDQSQSCHWKAPMNDKHWCVGRIESQCTVENGFEFMTGLYENLIAKKSTPAHVAKLWPDIKSGMDPWQYWNALELKEDLISIADEHFEKWKGGGQYHIGMHLRRGDFMARKFTDRINDQKTSPEEKEFLTGQWTDADSEVEAHVAMNN